MACIFCEIVAGRIPSKTAYQDDQVVAFHDVNPQAPAHVLVVPRRHVESLNAVDEPDDALLGKLVRKARDVARELGLHERGFRLVFNCGNDAGYSVYHVHLHLLGGRPLGWPPG
jgi:histidine triad (HIT) family protein